MTVEDSDRVISRYSQLARAAIRGDEIRDGDPSAFADGCFGAAAYADRSQAPEAAFEAMGTQLSASNRADYARHLAIARASMRPAAFTAAWTCGQQLPLQQAVDEALQMTESGDSQPHANTGKRVDRPAGARARAQREASPLTAREQQVAELVRRGLTNRLIGEALVITEGTAALHVKNALSKLGFTSRAQLASWATEHRELSMS